MPLERNYVIEKCGSAFFTPVTLRDNYKALTKKWNAAADFLAAYNGEHLGYVIFYANNIATATAYISMIAVHPLYQNKRIGNRLLLSAEEIAKERGMRRVELEVRSDNEKAIAFYNRNGFTSKAQNGTQSNIMEKNL